MTDNLYAAPQADMTKTPVAVGSDDSFFVVSPRKFILMFIFTFSLYQVYWFYKNWSNYQKQARLQNSTDSDIWPVARAIFSVFFIHALFRRVDKHAEAKQRPLGWDVDTHATTLVVLVVLTNLNGLLLGGLLGPILSTLVGLGLLGAVGFSMHKAQPFINKSCNDPEGLANNKLTPANYGWMVVGVLLWISTIAGMFATAVVPGAV